MNDSIKASIALIIVLVSSIISTANGVFFLTRFDTVNDIPATYFQNNNIIHGRVVRVIDGDTIRVLHCRTRFSCPSLKENERRIYDKTLSIRLYGVDAPELQKRKSDLPSQPFAEEAKDLITNLVLDKKVSIKLLRRDQYGRAVANVQTTRRFKSFPPLRKKDLSIELSKRGLATLYTGGGAEYDGNREILEAKEMQAKRKGRGVFSINNKKDFVSPAEFKRQQKLATQK